MLDMVAACSAQMKQQLSQTENGKILLQLSQIHSELNSAILCLQLPPAARAVDVSQLFLASANVQESDQAQPSATIKNSALEPSKREQKEINVSPSVLNLRLE